MMICCSASASSSSSAAPLSKDEEYNRNMQREMRNPYEYHHDLGLLRSAFPSFSFLFCMCHSEFSLGISAPNKKKQACFLGSAHSGSAGSRNASTIHGVSGMNPMSSGEAHGFFLLSFVAGIYYTRILDNVLVGSQPQTPADIDRLHNEEGVRAILNLQQDKDIEYWGVDINSITKRCEELGIVYMRNPVSQQ
jgi:hypothetical protein